MNIKTKKINWLSKKVDYVKVKVRDYNDKIAWAYDKGYQSALKDFESMPKSRGARGSATVGYSRGLSDSYKYYKYNKKIKGEK